MSQNLHELLASQFLKFKTRSTTGYNEYKHVGQSAERMCLLKKKKD